MTLKIRMEYILKGAEFIPEEYILKRTELTLKIKMEYLYIVLRLPLR